MSSTMLGSRRKTTTLPGRKLSVQSHMLGGQTVRVMIKARHAEEVAEAEAQKKATTAGPTPNNKYSPSRTKGTPYSRDSGEKGDREAGESDGSEDSSSGDSDPGTTTPGRAPGASIPTDTPAGWLARRIVNKLAKQKEPDLGEIHRLTDAAKRGLLKLLDLQLQYSAIKANADLAAKEAFASTYTDQLQVGLDPLGHPERYLMEDNPRHVIKLMDNVIYAKHKLVADGERSPPRPGIFLNRKDVSKWKAK